MSEPLTDEELASIEQDADAGLADDGWSLIGADEVKRIVREIRHLRAENERLTAAMLLLQSPKVES